MSTIAADNNQTPKKNPGEVEKLFFLQLKITADFVVVLLRSSMDHWPARLEQKICFNLPSRKDPSVLSLQNSVMK